MIAYRDKRSCHGVFVPFSVAPLHRILPIGGLFPCFTKIPMLKLVLSVWLWHNPKFKIYIYFSSIVAQKNNLALTFNKL
jgi:hypothetical protein